MTAQGIRTKLGHALVATHRLLARSPETASRKGGIAAEHTARTTDNPAESGRWIGYVDRVESGIVRGWCCDLSRPNESVCVEAIASSGRRLVIAASLYRKDVAAAGFGNGNHGFEIDLRKLLTAGETADLRFLDSKVRIGKGAISLDAQIALLTEPLPPAFLDLMRQLAADLRLKHAEMQATLGVDEASTTRMRQAAKRAARP